MHTSRLPQYQLLLSPHRKYVCSPVPVLGSEGPVVGHTSCCYEHIPNDIRYLLVEFLDALTLDLLVSNAAVSNVPGVLRPVPLSLLENRKKIRLCHSSIFHHSEVLLICFCL